MPNDFIFFVNQMIFFHALDKWTCKNFRMLVEKFYYWSSKLWIADFFLKQGLAFAKIFLLVNQKIFFQELKMNLRKFWYAVSGFCENNCDLGELEDIFFSVTKN